MRLPQLPAICLLLTAASAMGCHGTVLTGEQGPPPDGNGGGGGDNGGGNGGGDEAGGAGGREEAPPTGCVEGSIDMAGCACATTGEKRACGRGVGICKKGEQVCEAGDKTLAGGAWGPCMGGVSPGKEVCGDGLDNDCDGRLDCADPECDTYCKSRDAGASPDGPPPSEGCPCSVKVCDSFVTCGHPPYQTCAKGEWSRCRSYNYCSPEPLPAGKTDECQGHLDCPKGELCDTGGFGTTNKCIPLTDPQFHWSDPAAAVTCSSDADCDGACKFSGACKCHDHGLCVKDCVSTSECGSGTYCNIIKTIDTPMSKTYTQAAALVGTCDVVYWTDCEGKKTCS